MAGHAGPYVRLCVQCQPIQHTMSPRSLPASSCPCSNADRWPISLAGQVPLPFPLGEPLARVLLDILKHCVRERTRAVVNTWVHACAVQHRRLPAVSNLKLHSLQATTSLAPGRGRMEPQWGQKDGSVRNGPAGARCFTGRGEAIFAI